MSIIKREFTLVKKYYEDHEEQQSDIYTFVVSTPEVDRYGTIIIPSGINYTAYLNNPIVLAQHNADEWPIGKCLGFMMNGENLEATLQLHRITDEACEVADLVAAGYVKAVSVGIIPTESEEQTIDGKKVTVYTKSELVEFSVVSIPANRDALIKKSIKELFKSLKKVTRMLTPEQTQAITDNFLPILQDAALTYLRDELGIAEEEAAKAAEAGTLAAAEAMLVVLNGDAPEVAPTATEEPAPTEAPAPAEAPVATAGYNAPQTRLGKKIAASTQAQISEGLSMIQDGYKTINKAIVMESARSINIKPLTKLSTEEIMNLI
jgi:HK97 family phage prohead protease